MAKRRYAVRMKHIDWRSRKPSTQRRVVFVHAYDQQSAKRQAERQVRHATNSVWWDAEKSWPA